MEKNELVIDNKVATGYVIPIGPVNLVFATGEKGLLGCGAIDVAALANFSYPAARVRPGTGSSIGSLDDLLSGVVKEANGPAEKLGLSVGMTGREALSFLV
ncbi:MAG: YunC family protein [Methanospirillaceae archaeon]|nr:YunC family protein [Methanospirillaceae archaeon]